MRNLQFSINSTLEPEKLMTYIIDFESYKNFFPNQIKEVKILDRQDNEITTEETTPIGRYLAAEHSIQEGKLPDGTKSS